jgi:hypothetical protein
LALDLAHEAQEVLARVCLGDLVGDLPGRNLECGAEVDDAVPLVVVCVADGAFRAQRQWRLRELERLIDVFSSTLRTTTFVGGFR